MLRAMPAPLHATDDAFVFTTMAGTPRDFYANLSLPQIPPDIEFNTVSETLRLDTPRCFCMHPRIALTRNHGPPSRLTEAPRSVTEDRARRGMPCRQRPSSISSQASSFLPFFFRAKHLPNFPEPASTLARGLRLNGRFAMKEAACVRS